MSKKVKSLLLVLCAIVFFAAGIFATLAYLSSTTKEAKNTVSIGDVYIELDEAPVDSYGVKLDSAGNPVDAPNADTVYADRIPNDDPDSPDGNDYLLVPDRTYTKDPVVHVKAGSEFAYLFVRVDSDIAEIEANVEVDGEGNVVVGKIHDQMVKNGWVLVDGNQYPGLYKFGVSGVYTDAKSYTAGEFVDVPVFEQFRIDAGIKNADLQTHADDEINVKAYAIQEFGVDLATAIDYAWAELNPNPAP